MAELEHKGEASGDPKMDRALSAFSAYLKNERNASAHTVDSYRLDILQFARMMLETDAEERQADWNSIDVYGARTYIVRLQDEEGVSKTSILRKLSGMRTFYRFMQREGLARSNPFFGLKAPKREKLLPKYMSVDEVGRLLDAPAVHWRDAYQKGYAKDEDSAHFAAARDAAILEVIYSGGLRISEAIGLDLEDLDLVSGVMRVRGKGNNEKLFSRANPPHIEHKRKCSCVRQPVRTASHAACISGELQALSADGGSADGHDAAQAAPLLRHSSAGCGRRSAKRPGASLTRQSPHDADEGRLQHGASARVIRQARRSAARKSFCRESRETPR